jgi:hypothetical protein
MWIGGVMQDHTVTLIVAVAGIAGTFGSGFLTQRLAQSSERKQWLRNARKEEFRELLTTLNRSFMTISELPKAGGLMEHRNRRSVEEAKAHALRVINDRIFIREDVKRDDIMARWAVPVSEFEKDLKVNEFANRFEDMSDLIAAAASK